MKRLCSAILAVCLIAGIAVPARAVEDFEEISYNTNIVVSSFDELQTALVDAQDGDTIAVSSTIVLEAQTLKTDKDIVIVRHSSFENGALFILCEKSVFDGFAIEDDFGNECTIIISASSDDAACIQNCTFNGNKKKVKSFIKVGHSCVVISDCTFMDNIWIFVSCESNSNCTFNNCEFSGSTNGAISTIKGKVVLNDCTITDNFSYADGAINSNGGEVYASNCTIQNNDVHGSNIGLDIYSIQGGILSIESKSEEDSGYYNKLTGSKMELPLINYAEDALLVYMKDDIAAETFAPTQAPEDDNSDNKPSESPQEPQTPEDGEDAVKPSEPSEDTAEDNDTSTTPSEPPQSDDDDEDDYTPPTSHKPVHRPSKPNVTTPEPEVVPALACGDAVIDISRSVVLLGYGDGLLHLEDYLTRAQMAAIIYRLLDETSVEDYDSGDSIFDDVLPEAWYYRYVSTIANAKIVFGTGNGKYNPDAPLTWGHIITVLSRFVETQEYELQNIQYDGWALNAVKTAVALGWIEDDASFEPDAYITRGEFVAFVNSVLEKYR